ncbi:MAG: ABC transporter substrate-binding protein [Hyphomicrobiales bacterium]|nr:ABC transporter substrate-binding protein [Alphaproteobacteria bacterium]
MKRRAFITLLGGVATWPIVAQAQQVRHVGVLIPLAEEDPEGQARLSAFQEGLRKLGWVEGGNIRFAVLWGRGDAERIRRLAAELSVLRLDAILASASPAMAALRPVAGGTLVVFAQVTDPVASGFVASLAHPGANVTGFTQYEYSVASKWLELLKEIAPWVTRVAVLFDPGQPSSLGYVREIEATAKGIGVGITASRVTDALSLQDAINALVAEQNGGLIIQAGPVTNLLRDRIIALAAQFRLPAIYPRRAYVASGGLASYGVDNIDMYGRAAGYVDRILRGEKPGDLPVQQATKFELVINLKTAKTLGINVPPTLLARAHEVIE